MPLLDYDVDFHGGGVLDLLAATFVAEGNGSEYFDSHSSSFVLSLLLVYGLPGCYSGDGPFDELAGSKTLDR